MKRKLEIGEIKSRQIRMLEYFDRFCRENDIPYFLSYGTLLGAVRNKGYIPWDDDVDVMVRRPDIVGLVKIFNEKSDGRYSILSIDNCATYDFPYPRIVDNTTLSKIGLVAVSYGINIDIYPIDAYPNDPEEENVYRKRIEIISKKRVLYKKWYDRIIKRLPIPELPFNRPILRKYEKAMASADYSTARKVHICNLQTEPIDKSIFENRVEVVFEEKKYFAPAKWDFVLRNWYGDYMILPPEDKRHPYHGFDNIYEK